MEENREIVFNKEANKNKYLLSLVIGAILFLLLSMVYTVSIRFLLSYKYPGIVFDDLESNPAYYEALSLIQFLYQIPLIFFFIFMLKADLKNDFKIFKSSLAKNIGFIFGGFVLCIVLTYVSASIYEAFGIVDTSENQEIIDTALGGKGNVFMALSVVLCAPFVEEMLFRKSLCDTLKYKFHVHDVLTIILSTLIFSFMHVTDFKSIIFIFQYIPLALVIVLSYYFTKSIYVSMGIHLLNNLFSVIATLLYIYGGLE